MKNIYRKIVLLGMVAGAFLLTTSCTFDEVVDPNGPSVNGVAEGASIGQLNELVVGVESSARNGLAIETTASGTLGRELYLFDADPRNTGDLLGKNGIGLDNNSFYSTAQWNGSYRCVKNANLLIDAANNTDAITVAERNGYSGFAKTMIAYELIQMVKSYGRARVDVSDPDNLGPILDESAAYAAIKTMLDEAASELNNGTFIFSLSPGFDGFEAAGTFRQFNRGIAAMLAVYMGDGTGALSALNGSHFSLGGDLNNGPKHFFAAGGNDQLNGLFKVASDGETTNLGDNIIVHPSWVDDAEEGDTRVADKSEPTPDPSASLDGLFAVYETTLYSSTIDPIDILRNEELILIYAEASVLAGNLNDAENALNVIRNAAGLPNKDYGGSATASQLNTEMLVQRRYSLWGENHRMYDMRRFGLSGTLPIDRPGDQVFNTLPVPLAETN